LLTARLQPENPAAAPHTPAANTTLEQTLQQKESRIGTLADTLHEKDIAHEKLQTESDTLRGQLLRLEQQWRDTTAAHEQAIKALENQHR